MTADTILSVREAVAFTQQKFGCKLSERTVRRWACIGHIASTRNPAGHYGIPKSEILRIFRIVDPVAEAESRKAS